MILIFFLVVCPDRLIMQHKDLSAHILLLIRKKLVNNYDRIDQVNKSTFKSHKQFFRIFPNYLIYIQKSVNIKGGYSSKTNDRMQDGGRLRRVCVFRTCNFINDN